MSTNKKIALVTGGNKGIGFAICKALAANPSPPVHVLLGSRDPHRGRAAAQQLQAQGLDVEPITLDITDKRSIDSAANLLTSKYGGLDILVNNAGIASKGDAFNADIARTTIDTNYYGTKQVYDRLAPLLRANARVVNLSSMASRMALRNMSQDKRERFLHPQLTIQQLDDLMEEFIRDVRNGDYAQKGWPRNTYAVSKAGVSMLTRIHGRDNQKPGVSINCCCPGWVRTDMAGDRAPKTPDQGAVTPVKLALLPDNKITGGFWEDETCKPYV